MKGKTRKCLSIILIVSILLSIGFFIPSGTAKTKNKNIKVVLNKTQFTFTNKDIKPKIKYVKYKEKKLPKKNYKIKYPKESKLIGTYKVKITLKGKYKGKKLKGTKTVSYDIIPPNVPLNMKNWSYTQNTISWTTGDFKYHPLKPTVFDSEIRMKDGTLYTEMINLGMVVDLMDPNSKFNNFYTNYTSMYYAKKYGKNPSNQYMLENDPVLEFEVSKTQDFGKILYHKDLDRREECINYCFSENSTYYTRFRYKKLINDKAYVSPKWSELKVVVSSPKIADESLTKIYVEDYEGSSQIVDDYTISREPTLKPYNGYVHDTGLQVYIYAKYQQLWDINTKYNCPLWKRSKNDYFSFYKNKNGKWMVSFYDVKDIYGYSAKNSQNTQSASFFSKESEEEFKKVTDHSPHIFNVLSQTEYDNYINSFVEVDSFAYIQQLLCRECCTRSGGKFKTKYILPFEYTEPQ